MPDLLIELFSEEIPARMQGKAADDLKKLVTNGLVDAGLTYASAGTFSTPRRLVLAVEGLLGESPEVREERRGPKVGAPEKALEGFLRGAGVAREDLVERDEKKGAFYFATIVKPGRPAADIIAEVLEGAIRNFPWQKSMRWGTGSLRWVRPLHSIIALLSDETGATVVPMDIDGITSGDFTEGHRFMAPGRISVTSFDDYAAKLKSAHVILDASERQDMIWQDATNQAFAQGLEIVEDPGLLREVAGLVEWPVVLMGDIADDFLDLPPEVLQTSMKEHQKFFSVRDPKSGKIVKFITVANRETKDNGATILAGNQKVLFARLSDAKFFWENDLRVATGEKMEPWLASLANVTFHNKLGSQKERIERIVALARELAPVVGADADLAEQAARVAKADLSSEMVYEFPELQGLMGRYYAAAAGLPAKVAEACEAHYSPLGPSDDVPTSDVSVAVALADKLDLLCGFWAIDEKPTGSKDPFALRRAALGVIRLVLENGVRMELADVVFKHNARLTGFISGVEVSRKMETLKAAVDSLPNEASNVASQAVEDAKSKVDGAEFVNKLADVAIENAAVAISHLLSFFHDRLKVFLKDQGIRHDVIDACLAMDGNDDLVLLVNRAKALSALLATDDGENLLQGFKRANNLLTQAEEKDGVEYSYGADVKFAEDDSEKALFAALDLAEEKIAPAMKAEDFAAAMGEMAALRAPVDAFFEAVQVNSDNQVVRRNRLNLLSRIRTICLSVADLTKVEG
ncbi:glycine--tRNA ligase subunit beta [Halocynthiibacter styelae]|uniref:Glycine--tRNA ligase beta subunit n=1 Tax=Halocynthiibacter styelae TaxID=2761955 RepID=A0A8J7IUV2_9RHOB|nr:glycine--tRNA ligase subunit beta [Paenihalocynthiibacter styelae]MBI1493279.1 glycine--tRNA ligase subunit beta [Paenihalocynthiibacter styelae]